MANIEKTVFYERYSYKDFNFIIRIIQKEWGLDGEGFHNDYNVSGSKAFSDPANTQDQLLQSSLKSMVDNIKESLRVYADYEIGTQRKALRRRSYRQYRAKVRR